MEKCWGTPVADRDNTMRYYMIQVSFYSVAECIMSRQRDVYIQPFFQDACPVAGDTSLKVHSNGVSLQGRFDLKMFKFIGDDLNDVWLHCSVRACEATNAEDCVPQCGQNGNRRRRSTGSNNSKGLNYVSLEAVLLADLPIQDRGFRKSVQPRNDINFIWQGKLQEAAILKALSKLALSFPAQQPSRLFNRNLIQSREKRVLP